MLNLHCAHTLTPKPWNKLPDTEENVFSLCLCNPHLSSIATSKCHINFSKLDFTFQDVAIKASEHYFSTLLELKLPLHVTGSYISFVRFKELLRISSSTEADFT